MTKIELRERLVRTMRAQDSDLEGLDYEDAIADAESELGWSLPQTAAFRVYWLRERATRHLLHFLCIGSARKFRAEGYHLHQRYKHYTSLVESMDKLLDKAIADNPHEFAGVDTNKLGEDTTYQSDNVVIITPTETG